VAIERMKRVTVLFPSSRGDEFEEWLYSKSVLHLVELDRDLAAVAARGDRFCLDEQRASANHARAAELAAEGAALHARGGGFLDSLFPVKTVARRREVEEALLRVPLADLHAQVKEKSRSLKGCIARREHLRRERAALRPFEFLSLPLAALKGARRLFVLVAEGDSTLLSHLAGDEEAARLLAWHVGAREVEKRTLLLCGRRNDRARCLDILHAHGFRTLDFPEFDGTVRGRLDEIAREEKGLRTEEARLEAGLRALLPAGVARGVDCLKGHWESEKRRAENARLMRCAGRVGVARGYAPARELPAFAAEMARRFPGASLVAGDPAAGEEVPVSLRLPSWLRPAQLLVNMFGLPNYFALDPTPFLVVSFLAFFGICFADVAYGLLLILLSALLMRRYAAQEGLRDFFKLFLYCGASCILFGVLTGSWAADIYNPDYLGPDNILLRVARRTTLIDMLQKPVIALLIALAIGVCTQCYGILLKVVQGARQRDWETAVYDGVLWLVYLGGLIATSLALMQGWGPAARGTALAVLLVGAAGLVLTQGRAQKNWVARILIGLVSLYGVMGTYGTTSFVGDVISYSRLLALGLTTFVVGMAFNIIAKLASSAFASTPLLAGAVFAVLATAFHLFNFAISVLSGFVHSARLILLEFFGRFYEGGGRWFRPHGFSSDTLEITR
jgi:V/A-type H+-transporting ATPase subunit I